MCDTIRQRKEKVKGAVVDAQKDSSKNMKGETLLYVCEWQGEPKYTYLRLKPLHMRIM